MKPHIFISYSTKNADTIDQLRQTLKLHGQCTWVDCRHLTAGDDLVDKIGAAITHAQHFIVVVSLAAMASKWVKREIRLALKQVRQRNDGFRVIPLVLPDVDEGHLDLLFGDELKAVFVKDTATGFDDAMQEVFAALGMQLPNRPNSGESVTVNPIEELVLELTNPCIKIKNNQRLLKAQALLRYLPAHSKNAMISKQYHFTAPFGAIELAEIRWYIESYFRWPTGVFKARADKTEQGLINWGKLLFDAVFSVKSAKAPLNEWRNAGQDLRFSVQVDFEPPEDTEAEQLPLYREAASDLLALPWEILHDGHQHFFQSAQPIQIRRRLPKRAAKFSSKTQLPIRVLLLSPRPEVTKDGQKWVILTIVAVLCR